MKSIDSRLVFETPAAAGVPGAGYAAPVAISTQVPPPPGPAQLFVGEHPISEADVAREMQHHPTRDPMQSRAGAARALVVRELLLQEVARQQIGDQVECHDRETREEACIRVLIERSVDVLTPTPEACRHYFQSNRERFHEPDRVQVRHILLKAAPDDIHARLQARTTAEELIAQLVQHPERFTEFAQRHSACPSRDQGGELGWLVRGQTTPEFDRQLFKLRDGIAAYPVESRYGHHVVSIDAIERGQPLDFESVQQLIVDYLEVNARQQTVQQFLTTLEARYPVRGMEIYEAQAA